VWRRDLLPHVVNAFGLLGAGGGVYGAVRSITYLITWRNALYGDAERSKRAFRLLKLPPLEPDSGDSPGVR
jgi:hypothetical protein